MAYKERIYKTTKMRIEFINDIDALSNIQAPLPHTTLVEAITTIASATLDATLINQRFHFLSCLYSPC